MQLQADREHFVGICGGSSGSSSSSASASPSCSPPSKDSPLSLLAVANLRRPRASSRVKDRVKDKTRAYRAADKDSSSCSTSHSLTNINSNNSNNKDEPMPMAPTEPQHLHSQSSPVNNDSASTSSVSPLPSSLSVSIITTAAAAPAPAPAPDAANAPATTSTATVSVPSLFPPTCDLHIMHPAATNSNNIRHGSQHRGRTSHTTTNRTTSVIPSTIPSSPSTTTTTTPTTITAATAATTTMPTTLSIASGGNQSHSHSSVSIEPSLPRDYESLSSWNTVPPPPPPPPPAPRIDPSTALPRTMNQPSSAPHPSSLSSHRWPAHPHPQYLPPPDSALFPSCTPSSSSSSSSSSLSSWPCHNPLSAPLAAPLTGSVFAPSSASMLWSSSPPSTSSLSPSPSSSSYLPGVSSPPSTSKACRLLQLPSELLFSILCRLSSQDLSRLAQTCKQGAGLVCDPSLWRNRSNNHVLYHPRHLSAVPEPIPWLPYYKYLEENSRQLEQNWDDATPQAVYVLEDHTGLVSCLELSMWTLVTGSMDSTVRVWDLRTLQCVQVLHSHRSLTCVSLSEAANAVCARTSFGGLYIWDIKTGEIILQDDTAMPYIASFIYMDNVYIGYGQCDGVITVFDWSSRTRLEVVGTYQAHEGDVIHISIKNGKDVISASTNGETLVYSLAQSRVVERILLPHATQAIQFTPTIHGDKAMFSTRDAVYEYELMLGQRRMSVEADGTAQSQEQAHLAPWRYDPAQCVESADDSIAMDVDQDGLDRGSSEQEAGTRTNHRRRESQLHALTPSSPTSSRSHPTPGRVWKTSNSLLSQIRQRVGMAGKPTDQERLQVPTRFPRLASVYCLPRTSPWLDHGTTSARDSYGVFMPQACTRLNEISVYTRTTKQVKQIRGPAVDEVLSDALRSRFYTTMECNQHCAVVSSGSKIYIISFLPTGV